MRSVSIHNDNTAPAERDRRIEKLERDRGEWKSIAKLSLVERDQLKQQLAEAVRVIEELMVSEEVL